MPRTELHVVWAVVIISSDLMREVSKRGWSHVGVDLAADGAVWFAALVIAPFVVMVALGVPSLSSAKMFAGADAQTQDWGGYITVLLWNTNGFESTGTIAGDVAEPGKIYMPAMIIAMLGMILIYLLPIMVGVCAVTSPAQWSEGAWPLVG